MERDILVIGGGILGLATAMSLRDRHPGRSIAVVEKEDRVARHQSGRNSGVIHSGLYYRPGSLKARLCRAGAARLTEFCDEHGVPYRRGGKVVVATSEGQMPALMELERRGRANGLAGLRLVGPDELMELEPHARAVAALHVPATGTVDYAAVCEAIAAALEERAVEVMTSFEVRHVAESSQEVRVVSTDAEIRASVMVNCAGLYSDRIARLAGLDPQVRIVPFRGEYYDVAGESAALVRSSIYPVPDPGLPFLGVHLTRGVGGSVHAGPNAVLAGAREGYRWATVRPGELWNALAYPGLWRLAARHWRAGAAELLRSASRRRFAESCRELVPDIADADLSPGVAGVRAQAMDRRGRLCDDFVIEGGRRSVHVLNAPSPGATSSLAIGDHVAGLVDDRMS